MVEMSISWFLLISRILATIYYALESSQLRWSTSDLTLRTGKH